MNINQDLINSNKAAVLRFNREVIERGEEGAARDLLAPDFVNHSAPAGAPNGPDSMVHTFNRVLRPALSNLRVEVLDQVAEGDKVVTRKHVHGTHSGTFLGIPATGRSVTIEVIDIVRLRDGQYVEHWGVNTLPAVLAQLRS